ncbi:MAG TPA: histidine--tRNA ligase [Candidatus Nanoarchaeia archaeon]|nr:histidine--tRNA ligase [Candidatus Nanoarchaeia archaeon]
MEELQNAKGTRDFAPEEKIVRERVVQILRETFEEYGYSPLETPILCRYDVLSAKYAGGSEILKETFRLKDQGERELALRYDLTVPLSKFVGINPQLKMPFKRYEIGRVFRDGPLKLGRYREFWQCDVDIVGSPTGMADAEILLLTSAALRKLQLNSYIEVNSRNILEGIMDYAGITGEQRMEAIISLDKIKKIGEEAVRKEMQSKDIAEEAIEKLMNAANLIGKNMEILDKLKKILTSETGKKGIEEIEQILQFLEASQVTNVRFTPSLARGLAYYTGPVFEAFLENSKITSSIAGGGRYDNMIGQFLGGKKEYPATGISFGLDVITEAMKLLQKAEQKTVVEIYVIPIGTPLESMKICEELREATIKCDIDLNKKGISKNLDYANSLGIPYVLFVGENELKARQFKLKNMKEGSEEMLSLEEVKKKFV